MRSSSDHLARARDELAQARARVLLFRSAGGEMMEPDGGRLEELQTARPASRPGLSLILAAPAYSPSVAAAARHLRQSYPIFPLLCVLPPPGATGDAEIIRLLAILGIRLLWHDREPAPTAIEAVLRLPPLHPEDEFVQFLARRGHPVLHQESLAALFHTMLEPRAFEKLRTRSPSSYRDAMTRWRRMLAQSRLPAPYRLRTIVRLVVAGARLSSPERPTVSRVAEDAGFGTPFHLSSLLQQHFAEREPDAGSVSVGMDAGPRPRAITTGLERLPLTVFVSMLSSAPAIRNRERSGFSAPEP